MSGLVQIRDVPEETRKRLKERAAAQGQSLNAYLLGLLERDAARPTVGEVLDRARARSEREGTALSVVDVLAAARAERDEELMRRTRL